MASNYRKRRVEIGTEWVAIRAEMDCGGFGINNVGDVDCTLRTDLADDMTEDSLPVRSQEFVYPAAANPSEFQQWRFAMGEAVVWLRTASGTTTVVCTWVA